MARIIPTRLPDDTKSTAERRLFPALHEGLGDEWTVIHSLPWLDDTRAGTAPSSAPLREGECDYLLLHPRHGMLALEAKSGDVRYDGKTKAWSHGDGTPMKDPFEQAQRSSHFLDGLLRRRVKEWTRARLPFGHAVAFPETDKMTGAFPPHVTPHVLLLRSDLERVESRVVQVLAHYARAAGAARGKRDARGGLDGASFDRVLEALLPVFYVHRSAAARLEDREADLFRLTREQIRTLDMVGRNKKLLVRGCAGSGKTVLAREDAARWSDEGANVLFVCYNIPLAEYARERLAERAPGVDVFHFHGLCTEVVDACGGAFPDGPNTQEFYDVTCPELLLEHLPGYPKRYDAVIADEAQDFRAEWWKALTGMLADPASAVAHVYTDPRQNIFGRDNTPPFTEPVVTLDRTCRNTAEIAELVRAYGDVDAPRGEAHALSVHGPDPVTRAVVSDDEERAAIDEAVAAAIDEHAVTPENIVVIGAHRFEHSALSDREAIGAHPLVDDVAAGPGVIRYATVWRFKGLECDCAILTGFDVGGAEAGDETARRLLYVAASRAKHCLWILRR